MIFYLNLIGVQVLPISAHFTATLRFVVTLSEMKICIRIRSPVGDIVDTTALELKEKIAR